MTALFPIFFKKFWSQGIDVEVSTFYLGMAHAVTSAVLALLSPVLGAVADRSSLKKQLLFAFSLSGIVSTGLLPLIAAGHWQVAILCFVIANLGFAGGNNMYDALLMSVAKPRDVNFISAFGFALGYLGGGLLFLLNVVMIMKPTLFALEDASEATRWAFASVALWWAVFTIPLLLFVPEHPPSGHHADVEDPLAANGPPRTSANTLVRRFFLAPFMQMASSVRSLLQHRSLGLFLLAYIFYIDGVNTIIKMSVDYGMAIGLKSDHLILAILIVQFVGFPATLLFGFLADRLGPKNSILFCIAVYGFGTIYAFFMHSEREFYVLAVLIGLVQGGVQSMSRAVFASMIPKGRSGEFFGLYNMLGKFSSILGPLLVGVVSIASREPRFSILSVILLFVVGAALLARVPVIENKSARS